MLVNGSSLDSPPPSILLRKTVRRAWPSHTFLLKTLKILKESELKKFKRKLHHFPIEKRFVNISKELLQEASVSDLSQLLLVYYGPDYALQVTARVLKAINCELQADREDDLVMPADVDRMQREVGKEQVWPLEGVAISAKKIICKGRKELIEILGRDILHVLYSRYIITRKEFWDLLEAEEDSKEKSKKLLHMIQERGEQACCRFLECVEMEHPGSIQNLLLAIQGSGQDPIQTPGHSGLQLESPLFAEEGSSTEMENPAGSGESGRGSWCPSEELPEKIKPVMVCDSEGGHKKYRVSSTKAGSFSCLDTDLICEVREAVTLTYYFDSWPKHLEGQTTEELHVAGPLLNIQVDVVEAVTAIHIPHFLSLSAEDHSGVYIAHFVRGEMNLEKPDRVEPHHVVLENPKFSSLGIVFKKMFKQKINTVARLYQRLRLKMPIFHLYLLPNDPSLIKAVDEHEANCHSRRIEKPPGTLKSLKIGTPIFVQTLDDVTIWPEEVKFQYLDAEKLQQYVELSAEQMQEKFSFTLVEKRTNKLIWKAHVNRGVF
uniref:Caspase recruitment domain family member 8 n=2 Tax=Podarcis muralis TaxID=64176 RepID=A0A670JKT3_PODMU